jgi:hypothetical protein
MTLCSFIIFQGHVFYLKEVDAKMVPSNSCSLAGRASVEAVSAGSKLNVDEHIRRVRGALK